MQDAGRRLDDATTDVESMALFSDNFRIRLLSAGSPTSSVAPTSLVLLTSYDQKERVDKGCDLFLNLS
jgi:hypothetical protein